MSQYMFGSGKMFATPLSDAQGNSITHPSPTEFGVLQDGSIEISNELKALYGSNQFPVEVGRGKGKITGKAKAARMNGLMLNNIVFGQTQTSGSITVPYFDLSGATIPASPFQMIIDPPNNGTYTANLGVTNANGVPMIRVASATTLSSGQYTVDESTGTYTFASADAGTTVFINYRYSAASAGAKEGIITNLPMGYAPSFSLDLVIPYKGKFMSIFLYKCTSTKLALATKLDDFTVPEFDFEASADEMGRVLKYSLSE